MNKLMSILIFLVFVGLVFSGVGELLNNICVYVSSMVPIISVILVVIAGLVYSIGKVLGQEYRAKTETWATTIVIGAVLGLILALSAPFIVGVLVESFELEGVEYTCRELME